MIIYPFHSFLDTSNLGLNLKMEFMPDEILERDDDDDEMYTSKFNVGVCQGDQECKGKAGAGWRSVGYQVVRHGWALGKRAAIAGAAVTTMPVLLPPLAALSALGIFAAFPFGVYLVAFACTDKLMQSLLPLPSPLTSPPAEEEKDQEALKVEMIEEEILGSTSGNDEKPAEDAEQTAKVEGEDYAKTIEVEKLMAKNSVDYNDGGGDSENVQEEKKEQTENDYLLDKMMETRSAGESEEESEEKKEGDMATKNENEGEERDDLEREIEIEQQDESSCSKSTSEDQSAKHANTESQNIADNVVESDDKEGHMVEEDILGSTSGNDEESANDAGQTANVEGEDYEKTIEVEKLIAETTVDYNDEGGDSENVQEEKKEQTENDYLLDKMMETRSAGEPEEDIKKKKEGDVVTKKEIEGEERDDLEREIEIEQQEESSCSEFASEDQSAKKANTESQNITDNAVESNDEVTYTEQDIWEQIHALRTIVGYKASPSSSYMDEIAALYIFTGVEHPFSGEKSANPAEAYKKICFLKSVIGVQ